MQFLRPILYMLTFSRTKVLSSIYLINWPEEEKTLSLFSLVPFVLVQIVRTIFWWKQSQEKELWPVKYYRNALWRQEWAVTATQLHLTLPAHAKLEVPIHWTISQLWGVMSAASCAQGPHCVLKQVLGQTLRGRTRGSFHIWRWTLVIGTVDSPHASSTKISCFFPNST